MAKLNPNERKKITSKKVGKWLAMSDDNGLIGVVAVKGDYPERLGYKMINVLSGPLKFIGFKSGADRIVWTR
jgi:hypothetical protein